MSYYISNLDRPSQWIGAPGNIKRVKSSALSLVEGEEGDLIVIMRDGFIVSSTAYGEGKKWLDGKQFIERDETGKANPVLASNAHYGR